MVNMLPFVLALALALSPNCGNAKTHRSAQAKAEFKKAHPCPATGKPKGACPGYVIDHVKALACGGADHPSNMQWQTVREAKEKDKWERKECGR